MTAAIAAQTTERLLTSSSKAAAGLAATRRKLLAGRIPAPERPAVRAETLPDGSVRLAAADDDGGGSGEVSVTLASHALEKLRALHALHARRQHGSEKPGGAEEERGEEQEQEQEQEQEEQDLLARLFVLVLRYQSIGGAGFQASLGRPVFDELRAVAAVDTECFASPLNCFFPAFCSAFPDVDGPFGSAGSFALFAPRRGRFEANPPFVDGVIDSMATHMLALLETAQRAAEPLSFVVVLPGWLDSAGWRALEAAPLRRATLQVAAADHGFVDGAQHARACSFRQSPYDTTLFFLQTDAAAAAHPLGAAELARVERALASCTPSEADLAGVELHERVERGSARRKLARRAQRAEQHHPARTKRDEQSEMRK